MALMKQEQGHVGASDFRPNCDQFSSVFSKGTSEEGSQNLHGTAWWHLAPFPTGHFDFMNRLDFVSTDNKNLLHMMVLLSIATEQKLFVCP